MIETNASLQQAQLRARLASAAVTLARQRAEKAVKLAIQREGRRKLSQVARREIVTLARDYLAAHPELIAEARPIVEQWAAEGFFGKRVARIVCTMREGLSRRHFRCAKLMSEMELRNDSWLRSGID